MSTIKLMWIGDTTFIIQQISEKGIVNLGCFSEKSRRFDNPFSFNDWLYGKLIKFDFTISDFENEEELKKILTQKFYEY